MKTRRITLAAMLLAIDGGILLLDRNFGGFFTDLSSIVVSVILAVYYIKYDKDRIPFTVGLILIAVLFGNISSYIYTPLGIFSGATASRFIKNRRSFKDTMLCTSLINTFGEIVVCLIVYPLLGISLAQQIEGSASLLNTLGIPFANVIAVVSLLLTAMIIAVCESFASLVLIVSVVKR